MRISKLWQDRGPGRVPWYQLEDKMVEVISLLTSQNFYTLHVVLTLLYFSLSTKMVCWFVEPPQHFQNCCSPTPSTDTPQNLQSLWIRPPKSAIGHSLDEYPRFRVVGRWELRPPIRDGRRPWEPTHVVPTWGWCIP